MTDILTNNGVEIITAAESFMLQTLGQGLCVASLLLQVKRI